MNTPADDHRPIGSPTPGIDQAAVSHLLIVDKPNLLLSVPGRHPLNHDCLLNRLSYHYPGVSAVHRLDLDTSGLMVIPRHETLSGLARQFQERRIVKPTSLGSRVTSPRMPANATCRLSLTGQSTQTESLF